MPLAIPSIEGMFYDPHTKSLFTVSALQGTWRIYKGSRLSSESIVLGNWHCRRQRGGCQP
jgi:hypothetical protein